MDKKKAYNIVIILFVSAFAFSSIGEVAAAPSLKGGSEVKKLLNDKIPREIPVSESSTHEIPTSEFDISLEGNMKRKQIKLTEVNKDKLTFRIPFSGELTGGAKRKGWWRPSISEELDLKGVTAVELSIEINKQLEIVPDLQQTSVDFSKAEIPLPVTDETLSVRGLLEKALNSWFNDEIEQELEEELAKSMEF